MVALGPIAGAGVALLCALCLAGLGVAASAAAVPSTGFLSQPTDQIGVPGMLAGGEITPEGDLYTGWAEYELRYGRRLAAWNQPTRTLPDPAVPLLSSTLAEGPVSYTQTVFAIPVAGRAVAYETVTVTNASDRSREAQVAMALAYTRGSQIVGVHGLKTGIYRYERPASGQPAGFYDQPGQVYSSRFRYGESGRDLERSGLLLARGPAAPSVGLGTPAPSTLQSPHDARLFRVTLRGHGRVSLRSGSPGTTHGGCQPRGGGRWRACPSAARAPRSRVCGEPKRPG